MSGEKDLPHLTAGVELRRALDEALQLASEDLNQPLEWTEKESAILERACTTADRAAVLRAAFEDEQVGEKHPSVMVKLSAEIRMLDKQVVDFVAAINPGDGAAKSERHQRAAASRWTPKVVRG